MRVIRISFRGFVESDMFVKLLGNSPEINSLCEKNVVWFMNKTTWKIWGYSLCRERKKGLPDLVPIFLATFYIWISNCRHDKQQGLSPFKRKGLLQSIPKLLEFKDQVLKCWVKIKIMKSDEFMAKSVKKATNDTKNVTNNTICVNKFSFMYWILRLILSFTGNWLRTIWNAFNLRFTFDFWKSVYYYEWFKW